MADNDDDMTVLDGVRLNVESTPVDSVTDGTGLVMISGILVVGTLIGRVGVTVGVIEITGGVTEGTGLTGGVTTVVQALRG